MNAADTPLSYNQLYKKTVLCLRIKVVEINNYNVYRGGEGAKDDTPERKLYDK